MPGATSDAAGEPVAPLDLLLISDQIGSSGATVPQIQHQVHEHFGKLRRCISTSPGVLHDRTSVIKNIGDSLMIRIRCEAAALPFLLSNLLELEEELRLNSTPDEPVKLRMFLIPLVHEGTEFIQGAALTFADNVDAIGHIRIPGGSSKAWLDDDLFGPRINLAFRAANLGIDEPILIIEDSIANHLDGGQGEVSHSHFDIEVTDDLSLRIGTSLPFSPIRGVDRRYRFGERNNTGWPGHLFLRSITRPEPPDDTDPILDTLSLEQQKYKVFTRFIWRGEPGLQDQLSWVKKIREFQCGASYFRNLLVVSREGEVRRRWPHDRKIAHAADAPMESVFHGGRSNDVFMRTGIIGVFAGPFESTYETIRNKIFNRRKEGDAEGFKYPLSTIVFDDGHKTSFDCGQANFGICILVFWRWLPEARDNLRDQCVKLMDHVEARVGFKWQRTGMVMGGEWDGYAVLRPNNKVDYFVPSKNKRDTVFRTLLASIATATQSRDVETMAVYLCRDPDVLSEYVESTQVSPIRQAS